MPARVVINEKEYNVKDLSSGGLAVRDVEGAFTRAQRIRLCLKLPFSAFALDVALEAEVRHYDARDKTLGCVFVNLSGDHVALLNHMLKSFIAGDYVAAGDVLGIAARDNFSRPRRQGSVATSAPDIRRQLPGFLAIAALGFLIVLFVAGNLYSSLFLVKTSNAWVAASTVDVMAPEAGIWHARTDSSLTVVQTGQILGTLKPSDGRPEIEVKSPCDCLITGATMNDGITVASGTRIVSLIPVRARPWITAEIDPEAAARLTAETEADIDIFGARASYKGRIAGIETSPASADGHRAVILKIVTDRPLPVDLVNRPVSIAFRVRWMS